MTTDPVYPPDEDPFDYDPDEEEEDLRADGTTAC